MVGYAPTILRIGEVYVYSTLLENSPVCYCLLGETDALALPNLAKYFLKIFVGLSLNLLDRTTTCVHLHSIFQLSQNAFPLADFPLVYRLYTAPSSLTPALRSRVGLAPLRLP